MPSAFNFGSVASVAPALPRGPISAAQAQAAETDAEWNAFRRHFRAEMAHGDAPKVLDLLAALSATTAFSIGCYCDDERHCHRSVLRELLAERGATIEPDAG